MPTLVDLTNQRFGKLIVLRLSTKEERAGRRNTYWHCKCDCGSECDMARSSLISVTQEPCCPRCNTGRGKAAHLEGMKIGELTVLRKIKDKNASSKLGQQWECLCSCGKICIKTTKQLRTIKHPHCGHILPDFEDLTGRIFGRLKVLERDYEKSKEENINSPYWKCQCSCGNITYATSSHLKQGLKKSCGCLAAESLKKMQQGNVIDETGNIYGFLQVLEQDFSPDLPKGVAHWKCKCTNCGAITSKRGDVLRRGDAISCGCIKSKGEVKIAEILQKANISYEKEKMLDECRFPDTNLKARFDFWVDDRYFIEYDGQQHFDYTNSETSWNTKENHERVEQRDEYKNQWCKENHIPIIRIPYSHYSDLCLEDLLLETSQYLVN